MNTKITLSQALEGYDLAIQARHLSEHTLSDYYTTYRKLQAYLVGDPPFAAITQIQLEGFLGSQTVSNKTILNYHIGLSALWTWAVKINLVDTNIVHNIERSKPQTIQVEPLSENDVRLILGALTTSKPHVMKGHANTVRSLPEADRNRAIVLLMLDTGLRASELCDLQIRNVDLRNKAKSITILAGKGNKDRHIPISPRTATAIWQYLASDRKDAAVDEPLFVGSTDHALDRNNLGKMLRCAAERVGVQDVHPHRFRNTFAINYLRNGGDIFTLQAILGHSSLDMVKRYLSIAQTDTENAHRKASPVDHWNL